MVPHDCVRCACVDLLVQGYKIVFHFEPLVSATEPLSVEVGEVAAVVASAVEGGEGGAGGGRVTPVVSVSMDSPAAAGGEEEATVV